MAIIPMTSGFTLCPAGVHVFRIYKVEYDEEFGKLTIHLVNAQGITHQERYSLFGQNGEMNEKACNAFSYFAKTAMRNYALEEIDHNDLVNHYIKAEVVHTALPSTKDPTKTITFANLGDKWEAEGFETTPVSKALTLGNENTATPAPTVGLDINALLNG